ERAVEGQKCFQHVLLAPETEIRHHELFRVIEGRKDIVKMDQDPGRQDRQNAKNLIEHIAVQRDHVARINKQNVVFAERGEELERHLLYRLLDNLFESVNSVFQILRWIGLDAGHFARKTLFAVLSEGRGQNQRRVPAPDFDNPAWLAGAHKGICNLRIDALEEPIVEMKGALANRLNVRKIRLPHIGHQFRAQSLNLL